MDQALRSDPFRAHESGATDPRLPLLAESVTPLFAAMGACMNHERRKAPGQKGFSPQGSP